MLDPSYPPARIKLIAQDAGLKALLVKDKDAFAEHSNVVKCPVFKSLPSETPSDRHSTILCIHNSQLDLPQVENFSSSVFFRS